MGVKKRREGERRGRQMRKSEEEREDIDRTSSRATRPPLPCQASWKERSLNPDFSFSALREYYFPFSITVYSRTIFSTFFFLLSLSLSPPSLVRLGTKETWWEKATRTRSVKNYHLAKAILHLRTCANCEVKPPRTCTAVRLHIVYFWQLSELIE